MGGSISWERYKFMLFRGAMGSNMTLCNVNVCGEIKLMYTDTGLVARASEVHLPPSSTIGNRLTAFPYIQ